MPNNPDTDLRAALEHAIRLVAKDADDAMHVRRVSRDVMEDLERYERVLKEHFAALENAAQPAGAPPADVIRLVTAARGVAFEDPSEEAIQELQAASEAFASRVCWDDEGGSLPDAHADPCTCGVLGGSAADIAIPAGMKPWNGGSRAPMDWDRGLVLYTRPDGSVHWLRIAVEGSEAWPDVIAYTPEAAAPSDKPDLHEAPCEKRDRGPASTSSEERDITIELNEAANLLEASGNLDLCDACREAGSLLGVADNGSGWIVTSGDGLRFGTWSFGFSDWTDQRERATRYARREDAEAVHEGDEDAWRVVPYSAAERPAGVNREAVAATIAEYQIKMGLATEDAWADGWGIADAILALLSGEAGNG